LSTPYKHLAVDDQEYPLKLIKVFKDFSGVKLVFVTLISDNMEYCR
jgi:hypothetical protein